MSGIIEMDGQYWVPRPLTLKMLAVSSTTLKRYLRSKRLTSRRKGTKSFYPLAEVEALARNPERIRLQDNRSLRIARRQIGDSSALPARPLNRREAARHIGVCYSRLTDLINAGRLIGYPIPANSRHFLFDGCDVEALRCELQDFHTKQAERKMEASRQKITPCRTRPPLKYTGTVQPGDISEFERYYGEWLTTRQVAMRLGISMGSVGVLRRTGRLYGEKRPTWFRGDKIQWHYRKTDVYELRDDPKYQANNRKYRLYHTPEGIAWREEQEAEEKAAQFSRQVEICNDLREKGLFADAKRNLLLRRW